MGEQEKEKSADLEQQVLKLGNQWSRNLNKVMRQKTQIIILKQPIWQTHGIYQKTIDEMSLERPIREHSIPHNPNFGKRQFDRLVDIWN